jgi:predicted AlkP superfamily pyrophosphatase or phosphodiesterase
MKFFSPKISKQLSEKNSLGLVPTIFDVMRSNDLDYFYQMPSTTTENALINNIIHQTKDSKLPKLTVIHPCSLDLIGHNFGPKSSQVQRALRKIDSRMLSINRAVQQSHDEITVIIMSDHGMTPIKNNANLLNILRHLHLELAKDYLVFLDSTVARFWFFDGNARKLVSEQLSNLKCGRILDASDLVALGIDEIGQEYGELFFAINEDYAIFPDFFRKHLPPRGMHGYAFSTYDAPIFVAYTSNPSVGFRGKNAVRFIDIMPTILEILNLPIPNTCEGTSFKL